MTPCRIAPILIAAVLAFSGCGDGCGGERQRKAGGQPRPTTTTAAPVVDPNGRHGLYRPSRWKVGDVVTSEATGTTTGRITPVAADGRPSPLPAMVDTVRATWVEKAVDVDADGHRTRYLVHLRAWSRRRGRGSDKSVEGTYLTVSDVGTARRWSFTQHVDEPTDEARNWLDEHFGSRGLSDEQWLRISLPDEDVAVGQSWSPDPTLFGTETWGTFLAIDPAGASATITLAAIEGGSARCTFTGKLALLRVPNSDATWSKGGTMTFEGDMSVALEPLPLSLPMLHRKATLEGETIQDDETLRYHFVSDERRTTTLGGDFPEPAH